MSRSSSHSAMTTRNAGVNGLHAIVHRVLIPPAHHHRRLLAELSAKLVSCLPTFDMAKLATLPQN